MNIVLTDSKWKSFLPLTYTRPISELRIGILTIKQKWELLLKDSCDFSYLTEEYLQKKYLKNIEDDNVFINSTVIPNYELCEQILKLKKNAALTKNDEVIAVRSSYDNYLSKNYSKEAVDIEILSINELTDIFSKNNVALQNDYKLITKGRESSTISSTNTLIGENIFIEEGAKVEAAILNAENGPIYIGSNAEIMEGAMIRGPFALCNNATVKMGAKIYGATTVGPFCKVGGEINNVVFQSYSNKGHDGFLGNSIVGEWCNFGADTNTSNLKNNYTEVKLWSYEEESYKNTGLQFCGLIFADHAKCGINTMFNTGTMVGVGANTYGGGYPKKFIPSFAWGGVPKILTYNIEKFFSTAEIVMQRRNKQLTQIDKDILTHIFSLSEKYRQ